MRLSSTTYLFLILKVELHFNVLNDIREEKKERQAKVMSSMDHLMTSLDHHNDILKQSNETRMQEVRRQLAAMQQMHREKMQMQQALIDALKSSK